MSATAVQQEPSAFDLRLGDCLLGLPSIADASVDALVTDPPAGIGFMGREWDSAKGGRVSWIAWMESVMREAIRVLKPGAHGVVWALPRTSHWTATALEQAGFEVRDVITHHFGTGFPKSLDVSKEIDKKFGNWRGRAGAVTIEDQLAKGAEYERTPKGTPIAAAAAAAAAAAGLGTALKPASEHWILVRKPLIGTVAANVMEHGTGAINVDACRIAGVPESPGTTPATQMGVTMGQVYGSRVRAEYVAPSGRWPANLVLSHTEWCEEIGTVEVKGDNRAKGDGEHTNSFFDVGSERPASAPSGRLHGDSIVTEWHCLPGCPVALLDTQSGPAQSGAMKASTIRRGRNEVYGKFTPGTSATKRAIEASAGGASRFFYVSKPTTAEREENVRDLPKRRAGELVDRDEGSAGMSNPRAGAGRTSRGRANHHPTVKSVALMNWLIKLVTPPGGLVLDCFTGSGTTGVEAIRLGHRFLGWELDEGYHRVATAKLERALRGMQMGLAL